MTDAKTLVSQARMAVSEIGYRFGAKQSAIGFIDRLAALAASHQAEVERLTMRLENTRAEGRLACEVAERLTAAQLVDARNYLECAAERDEASRQMGVACAQQLYLRAERDAAFAMSKCECAPDEACANLVRLTDDRDSWRDQASARTDDALRFAAECTEAYGARDAAIERANFMHGFAREAQELASKAQEDTRRLAAERDALRKDAAALDWLRDNLFTHHWNAVIGPGWRVDWKVVPHYRHIRLYDESGNAGGDFREAIRRAALADAQGAQT